MKIKTTVRGGLAAAQAAVATTPILVNPRRGCGTGGGIVRPVLTTVVQLA